MESSVLRSIDDDEYQALCEVLSDLGYPSNELSAQVQNLVTILNEQPANVPGQAYTLHLPSHREHPQWGFRREYRLESLPPSIGKLQSLVHLALSNWYLGLPEEIGCLTNLKFLSLHKSRISSLPASIGRLQSLEELDLSETYDLKSLPEEIGNLSSLKKMDLYKSSITSLPPSISHLQNLIHLKLPDSAMDSLPSYIGHFKSLERVNLTFKGNLASLPEEVGDLAYLKPLINRGLLGRQPCVTIGHLGNITQMNCAHQFHNYYYDHTKVRIVPSSIGNLASLKNWVFIIQVSPHYHHLLECCNPLRS